MNTPNSTPPSAPAPQSSGSQKAWLPDWKTMAKQAVESYKQNAVSYVLMMFINLVVGAGPLFLVIAGFMLSSMVLNESVLVASSVVLGLLGIVAVLWAMVFGAIGQVAIIQRILDESKGPIVDSYKKVLDVKLIFNYVVAGFFFGILLVVGFICFIIPGIYILVPLAYWPFVMVKERLGIIDSITRSFSLAKGFWWASVLRWGVFGVAMVAIDTVLRLPFGLVAKFVDEPIVVLIAIFLYTILSAVVGACLFAPLQIILGKHLYEGVSAAKKTDANASQGVPQQDKLVLAGIVVAYIIIAAIGSAVNPWAGAFEGRGYDYDSSYYDDYYNSYDSYYDDSYDAYDAEYYDLTDEELEELDRIIQELEAEYGNDYYGN